MALRRDGKPALDPNFAITGSKFGSERTVASRSRGCSPRPGMPVGSDTDRDDMPTVAEHITRFS